MFVYYKLYKKPVSPMISTPYTFTLCHTELNYVIIFWVKSINFFSSKEKRSYFENIQDVLFHALKMIMIQFIFHFAWFLKKTKNIMYRLGSLYISKK